MYGQLLEILFFIGIAVFIFTKLFAVLGTVDDEDPVKKNCGSNNMKDVTDSVDQKDKYNSINNIDISKVKSDIEPLILVNSPSHIAENIVKLQSQIPNFDLHKFLKTVRVVIKLILSEIKTNQDSEVQNSNTTSLNILKELIDIRFLSKLLEFKNRYDSIDTTSKMDIYVYDVSFFANNAIIKTYIYIQNIKEEWTFTRNINSLEKKWYVTNVESIDDI